MKRVSLDTAARLLGISQDAVRKRIKRGTIMAEKDKQGRWVVILEDTFIDNSTTLVQSMQAEIESLRQQNERLSAIIMTLSSRVPQLEEPREESRSWWRRLWGG